jgi:hypothetical protein
MASFRASPWRPRRRAPLTCAEVVEAATDFVEGALSAVDTARVRRHLLACAGCLEYLRQMRTTVSWLAGVGVRRRAS